MNEELITLINSQTKLRIEFDEISRIWFWVYSDTQVGYFDTPDLALVDAIKSLCKAQDENDETEEEEEEEDFFSQLDLPDGYQQGTTY